MAGLVMLVLRRAAMQRFERFPSSHGCTSKTTPATVAAGGAPRAFHEIRFTLQGFTLAPSQGQSDWRFELPWKRWVRRGSFTEFHAGSQQAAAA